MANFFSNLFNHKTVSVIGIDVGSSSIKVVQLGKKNGIATLESYGELALGPYAGIEIGRATNLTPEKLSEALQSVIVESKMTASSVGLAIPFGSSLITSIEMPASAQKQFDQIVPMEARKYIPVPITEVALDWWMIPKSNEKAANPNPVEKVEVLLVAIHNETLSKYQKIMNSTGLSATFFEIEIFSTLRSSADQQSPINMIVDLGAASTKVYIVEQGVIRASHIINRGAQDITAALSRALNVSIQDAEIMKRDLSQIPAGRQTDASNIISVSLDYIFAETKQVMESYKQKHGKVVSQAVMVGGGAMLKGILSYAENRLQIRVLLGDPFGKTDAPAFLAEVLKTTGPEFAVAVGVALRKLSEEQ